LINAILKSTNKQKKHKPNIRPLTVGKILQQSKFNIIGLFTYYIFDNNYYFLAKISFGKNRYLFRFNYFKIFGGITIKKSSKK